MSYNGSLDFLDMIKNSQRTDKLAKTHKGTDTTNQKGAANAPGLTNTEEKTRTRGSANTRNPKNPTGTLDTPNPAAIKKSPKASSIENVSPVRNTTVYTSKENETEKPTSRKAPTIADLRTDSRFIAVIDTETNWHDEVMSLGVALADATTYKCVEKRYYIFEPECMVGGMFSSVINIRGISAIRCRREEALADLDVYLPANNVSKIFAYNARFDYGHLPELQKYEWFDIMRLAAYKQYNRAIPDSRPCCKTGRLKSDYGVEPITRLLTGDNSYCETHNAVFDAIDELRIIELLGLPLSEYECASI
jgi:hypothetical protein